MGPNDVWYHCMNFEKRREIETEDTAKYNEQLRADMASLEKICTDYGGVPILENPIVDWSKNTPPEGKARPINTITALYLVDGTVVKHLVSWALRRTELISKNGDFESSIGFMAELRMAYNMDVNQFSSTFTSQKQGHYGR